MHTGKCASSAAIARLGHPEVNICFRFPESLFRIRVGRSEPRYLVPSKSVSNSKSSALHNRNAHSSTTCYRILAHAQTEFFLNLPNQNLGSVGKPKTNIHFWMALSRIYTQGVVTPIGAVLKAETGDTICVHRNLAVTP